MGFRFVKRIKIAPGVRINLSKTGISTSFGRPGASVTVGRGKARVTGGIPGTGVSFSSEIGSKSSQSPTGPTPRVSQSGQAANEAAARAAVEAIGNSVHREMLRALMRGIGGWGIVVLIAIAVLLYAFLKR